MEKNREKFNFAYGDKVVYIKDGRTYDFGYIGQTGKAVIYEEGERNMQDAVAVEVGLLRKLKEQDI